MTQAFTEKFETDIHRTLNLTEKEYVKVTGLETGSVFVDFIILLRNDSQENRTTVYEKLYSEVTTNATGNLVEYFPVAEQLVVVLGKMGFPFQLFLFLFKFFFHDNNSLGNYQF